MTIKRHEWLKIILSGAAMIAVIFAFQIFGITHVLAQDNLTTVGEAAGLTATPLPIIIGRIISVFLGLLGIIFLILVLYAGYTFMTAAGDPDKVEKAKKTLVNGIIGLVIIMAAYAITSFVISALTGQGLWGGGGAGGGAGAGGGTSIEQYSGSLGTGALRDHYPNRNATDVPRNTKIMVTFRDAMDIESFVSDYKTAGTPLDISDDTVTKTLNANNVRIYKTVDGVSKALGSTEVSAAFTDDLKTFVFTPPILGSPTENTQYTVSLSDAIKTAKGEKALRSGGYIWSFTVGTRLDLEPPKVVSVRPVAGGTYGRNIAIQINFSEAVDPTVASGVYDPTSTSNNFQNIKVMSGAVVTASTASAAPVSMSTPIGVAGSTSATVMARTLVTKQAAVKAVKYISVQVAGTAEISNEYQTVTFVPSTACGTNSCGQTIYCLPATSQITTSVKPATPGANPPQVDVFPYDGIVDMCGNALDGNGDGTSGDYYTWNFNTNNDVVLDAPKIESIVPDIEASDIDLDQNVTINFDSVMLSSTLNADNIILSPNPSHEMWFKPTSEEITTTVDLKPKTSVIIKHGVFLESSETQNYQYSTTISEGVKNEYQNCYNPAEGPGLSGVCGTTSALPYCCNGVAQADVCNLFQ